MITSEEFARLETGDKAYAALWKSGRLHIAVATFVKYGKHNAKRAALFVASPPFDADYKMNPDGYVIVTPGSAPLSIGSGWTLSLAEVTDKVLAE